MQEFEIGGRPLRRYVTDLAVPMLARQLPNPVEISGVMFHYPERCRGSLWNYVADDFEPETIAVMRDLLRPGMTVFDVGANIGYFSVLFARAVGASGRVWAFEADDELATCLRRTLEGLPSDAAPCEVVNCAISDADGTAEFHRCEVGGLASSLSPGLSNTSSRVVATRTLDSIWRELGRPSVDLIKADIEGAEFDMLLGMRELRAANPGLELILELSPGVMKRAGVTDAMFAARLRELNFEMRPAGEPGSRNFICSAIA